MIDGVIGPQSRHAIEAFQADHGLPVAGQIDARLLKRYHLGDTEKDKRDLPASRVRLQDPAASPESSSPAGTRQNILGATALCYSFIARTSKPSRACSMAKKGK
jgi:peptidoglycan hydrolase-like protein with peptidoglycan-binding domain